MPKEENALDGLARHAIKEYKEGRTKSIEQLAEELGVTIVTKCDFRKASEAPGGYYLYFHDVVDGQCTEMRVTLVCKFWNVWELTEKSTALIGKDVWGTIQDDDIVLGPLPEFPKEFRKFLFTAEHGMFIKSKG